MSVPMRPTPLRIAALLLAGLLAAPLVAGCTETRLGSPIHRERIRDVVPGLTTLEDIERWFGRPHRITEMADRRVLVWRYADAEGGYEDLVVSVRDGVVVNLGSR